MANDQHLNEQPQQLTDSAKVRQSRGTQPANDRYHALFRLIGQGFHISELIHDHTGRPADWRFLEVNPAFEQQTGLQQVVGRLGRLPLIPKPTGC